MDTGIGEAGEARTAEHGSSRMGYGGNQRTRKQPAKRHRCPKPGCEKSFSRPSHLARHALNHSATEFECPRCRASFKRRDLLERHRARHVSKDRLAGGLGLGILRTKRLGAGRVSTSASLQGTSRAALTNAARRAGASVMSGSRASPSEGFDPDATMRMSSDDLGIDAFSHSMNPHSTTEATSTVDITQDGSEIPEGIFNADSFDFHGLGDMYHDSTFDLLHFHVTGGLQDMTGLADLSSVPGQAGPSILPSNPFDDRGDQDSPQAPSEASLSKSPVTGGATPSRLSDPEQKPYDSSSVQSWTKNASQTYSNSDEVESLYSLGRLGLNHLHLTERKRGEVLGLINDMRPVYPNGTLIDESTANLSLSQMQDYLDRFMSNFNSCYPMIHSASLEVLDADPLFLLSMMMLGATYSTKEDHQLSVCIYDAITPYVMGSLVGIEVPDLSILQALMILECYGMYRAGAYQRENAILMHTFLFTSIRRLSRYHVRARIMVPDLLADQEEDWKAFAHLEQYKRLILFVFMWDTQNVSYYSFMPSMSTQSIQVNLPCSKALWEAEDEATWKALMVKHRVPPMINSIVKDVIEDGGNIWCEALDGLALNLILHGLMSMCNDMVHFNNQSIYLGNVAEGDVSWTPWRRRMSDALELWKTKYDAYAMETRQTIDGDPALHMFREESIAFLALYHTAHVVANADVRHLQIAAGAKSIFGHIVTPAEQEESTKVVMHWVRLSPRSAGHAAWHAAQMVRDGLLNLRNWKANGMFHYPWCLYVSTLTCWAFIHFSRGQDGSDKHVCQHDIDDKKSLQLQSKALMHQTVSNMASSTPENIGKVLNRCCPHGLAVEIAKYLKTVRWTAAFEAMKVLEGLIDLDIPPETS